MKNEPALINAGAHGDGEPVVTALDAPLRSPKTKQRMKELLLFLPNMVRLLGRLMMDKRVPKTEKALVAGAIVYVISPIDLIPDFIPFIGQVDDAYLVALTLLRLINRTDEAIVREHWRGAGDIVKIANAMYEVASRILPKRVRAVLSSRVEMSKGGKLKATASE